MDINRHLIVTVCVLVVFGQVVLCDVDGEVTRPPPDCPLNCVCSQDLASMSCTNNFKITNHQFASLTKEMHLSRNFIGPILNRTFFNLNGLSLINVSNSRVNFIQSGAFSGLSQLKILILSGNNLQLIDESLFKDTIHLEVLDLSRNQLHFLSDEPFRYLPGLKVLNVSYNLLKSAHLGARFQVMTRLEVLDFSGNNIEHVIAENFAPVALWEMGVSRHLNLSHCGLKMIETAAIRKFPNLNSLSLAHNKELSYENISQYLEAIQEVQLKSLDVSYTNLSEKLNLADFSVGNLGTLTLTELTMAGNGLENIDDNLLSYLNLKKLDLSHNKLDKISEGLAKLQQLKHLDLSYNQISTVSEMFKDHVGNLEYLTISNNSLSDASGLNLEKAVKVVEVDLKNNLFENFAIPSQLVNLETLDISGNKIATLNDGQPLVGLAKLKHFDISNNKMVAIQDFIFRDSPNIWFTSFSGNEIASISHQAFLRNCPKILDLSKNKLEKMHLCGWHDIFEILLNDNQISEIDDQTFFYLLTLERLDLKHNKLTDLSVNVFAHLANLTDLDLQGNGLSELLPLVNILAPLGNLQKLDLSYNNFTDLSSDPSPFANNMDISELSVSNNKIRAFHPMTFAVLENLESLDFSRNPFHCACENIAMQTWIKHTNVYIRNQANLGYVCRSPNMRGTKTLMTYEVKTFECNRNLFYIVLFSSVGGASMVVALTLALVCYCVKRRRHGNLDLQSKEESMDLVEHEKNEMSDREKDAVTPDEYLRRIRNNYLKGTQSDTLIDVQFENPNLLLDEDVYDKKVNKKMVKRQKEEKQKSVKKKPIQKLNRGSLRASLDMKKLKYYAHLYDSMKHAKRREHKTLKNVKRRDKEKLKKLLEEMDKELKLIEKKRQKKAGGSKRKVADKKRRPRGNKDLVRMMSMKQSRSMPDVLSYVNSLPRHRYPDRDFRYEKVPIYHIDFSDPRARHGWVKSMVDIPRAHKSGERYAEYRQRPRVDARDRYTRLEEERERRYGRIPLGYHTISSGNRAHIINSKMLDRARSMDLRPAGDGFFTDEKWIPSGHMTRGHQGQRVTGQRVSTSVGVDETLPKSRLLVREDGDEGQGVSFPAGYHTIASTRGVTLAADRHNVEGTKLSRMDRAKSASTDGHLSQWV